MVFEQLGDASISKEFVGRRKILDEIYKSIDKRAPAVVVKGAGGAGKTALLRRVAAHLNKKQFSFIVIEGVTHPELILEKISLKAKKKGMDGTENIDETFRGDLRQKILWFVEHYLGKEKIMLVFEDFETNLDVEGAFKNERLKEFLMYLRDSLKEKDALMFFTTDTDIPGFESIPMPKFTEEEFKKLLSPGKALKRLNQTSREKLMFDMGTNPRAIRLLDHIAFLAFGEKKFDWDTLKKRIPNLAERILYKKSEEADFTPLLLEKLLESLTGSQQHLLKGLSIQRGAVGKEALEALQMKIGSRDRKRLVDLSLMEYPGKKKLYQVHPLTARFMFGKMSEEERKQLHLRAAGYFERLRGDENKTERDVENEIEIRRHYLEAEEWDKVAEMSIELDQYLTANGYPQLAFDLLKEIENKEYTRDNQIRLYQRLGIFYTLFGKFDEVITQNEKLIKIYEKIEDRNGMAHSLRQMAMAYEKKRKYDEALKEYDKSKEIFEKMGEHAAAGYNLLEMGKIHQKRGKYDEALNHFQKALSLLKSGNDPKGIAESMHQMGRVHEERGAFEKALEYYQQSQEVKETIGDEKEIASGLHQVGNVYFLKGEFDTALTHYQQSLTLNEKINDQRGAGYSLGQLGMIYQRKGQTGKALSHYKKSLDIFEKLGEQRGLSSGLHQLGRIYQDQGNLDKALEHYKKSLEIREKSADMPGMALGYGQLGILYFEKKEYEEALRSSVKAFVIFSKMNAPGLQLARKNILKVRDKLPGDKFEEILKEFNIQFEQPG
jgi:tetratricopeptide (TPR) repeat protein